MEVFFIEINKTKITYINEKHTIRCNQTAP